jgi:hypothetical protein
MEHPVRHWWQARRHRKSPGCHLPQCADQAAADVADALVLTVGNVNRSLSHRRNRIQGVARRKARHGSNQRRRAGRDINGIEARVRSDRVDSIKSGARGIHCQHIDGAQSGADLRESSVSCVDRVQDRRRIIGIEVEVSVRPERKRPRAADTETQVSQLGCRRSVQGDLKEVRREVDRKKPGGPLRGQAPKASAAIVDRSEPGSRARRSDGINVSVRRSPVNSACRADGQRIEIRTRDSDLRENRGCQVKRSEDKWGRTTPRRRGPYFNILRLAAHNGNQRKCDEKKHR